MDPTRLKMLVALSETGSLSRASRSMGVSRSAGRRLIDELSEEAGVALVEVGRSGAPLTPEGRQMAESAPALIQRAESLVASFSQPATNPGHFDFAVPLGLPPPVMARIVGLASRSLGRSRFGVIAHDDPLALLDGRAGAALVYGPEVPDGPWLTARVLTLNEGLGAAPSYLARCGTPRTLDELAEHRLLLWERSGAPQRRLPLTDGATWAADPWLASNNEWLIRVAAEQGAGVGLVQWGPLPLREGVEELVPVLPDLVHRACTLQVVVATAAAPRLRWRTLTDLARTVLRAF